MPLTKEEVNRKLLHILSGSLIPAGIFYLPQIPGAPPRIAQIILGILLFLSMLVEIIRLKAPQIQKLFFSMAGSMLRSSEKKEFTGATYIFASAFLCSIIFFNEPHISFIVISLFILGDAVAALVGISIGKIKIGKKSLEGSLACFLLSLLLLFAVYPYIPGLLDIWGGAIHPIIAIVAALSTTIFELFPIKITKTFTINDNLTVPIITGLLIRHLYPLF